MTVGEARKRINAIKQYSSLGAGFKIAMRDLEIRGAGNILGTAQSGHIVNVGFDLYCQLLRQAVARLRGEKVKPRVETTLDLDFAATNEAAFREGDSEAPVFLPSAYIREPELRIRAYRDLAEVAAAEHLDKLRAAWRDRFGPLVPPEKIQQCEAVHFGHHDVRNDQIRQGILDHAERIFAVGGGPHEVLLTKTILQKPSQRLVVFYNKYGTLVGHRAVRRLPGR